VFPECVFVGEQYGPPERLLKDRLVELFCQDKTVSAAYLVRVDLGNESIGVVLGLRTASGPNKQMVESVGKVFAFTFAGKERLDILFLSEAQETQLKQACKALFPQAD
jgi:hypothetical protein